MGKQNGAMRRPRDTRRVPLIPRAREAWPWFLCAYQCVVVGPVPSCRRRRHGACPVLWWGLYHHVDGGDMVPVCLPLSWQLNGPTVRTILSWCGIGNDKIL